MKKLFIFYLGGRVQKANIEIHDVFFGIGNTPQDCYNAIKDHWFGDLKGLHIDCYASIEHIDGYDVAITDNDHKQSNDNKLFFLNLGAYQKGFLDEKHHFELIIAKDIIAAKEVAKIRMTKGNNALHLLHIDNAFEIDDIIAVDHVIDKNYAITLSKSGVHKDIDYTHGCFLIDPSQ